MFLAAAAYSEVQPTLAVGDSVVTSKGYTFETDDLNEGSSLRHSWVTLNDTECPLAIVEAAFSIKGRSGDFSFQAAGQMKPSVPISAFEVHLLHFDVFGNPLTSLSTTVVTDYGAGGEVPLEGRWDMGWAHVEELLTVVVYVARVRTQEGVVWRYDEEAIAKSIVQLGLAGTPNL